MVQGQKLMGALQRLLEPEEAGDSSAGPVIQDLQALADILHAGVAALYNRKVRLNCVTLRRP